MQTEQKPAKIERSERISHRALRVPAGHLPDRDARQASAPEGPRLPKFRRLPIALTGLLASLLCIAVVHSATTSTVNGPLYNPDGSVNTNAVVFRLTTGPLVDYTDLILSRDITIYPSTNGFFTQDLRQGRYRVFLNLGRDALTIDVPSDGGVYGITNLIIAGPTLGNLRMVKVDSTAALTNPTNFFASNAALLLQALGIIPSASLDTNLARLNTNAPFAGWVKGRTDGTAPQLIAENSAGGDGAYSFAYLFATNISGQGYAFIGIAQRLNSSPTNLLTHLVLGQNQTEARLPFVADQDITVNGTLASAGGFSAAIITTTTNLTLGPSHYFVRADAAASNLVITVPVAALNPRRIYKVKKVDITPHTVTINPLGGNLDIGTNLVLALPGVGVEFHSDGSNWNLD